MYKTDLGSNNRFQMHEDTYMGHLKIVCDSSSL